MGVDKCSLILLMELVDIFLLSFWERLITLVFHHHCAHFEDLPRIVLKLIKLNKFKRISLRIDMKKFHQPELHQLVV